ncbi:phage portal protein [Virgibacillus salexigens]|uniref:phage portal protein n=1 Tax=Virgibacillus salexigens TaxID=61016 RepID=UPI00190B6833|nr:phage portal protein [Virgibacillus salexigens]
MASESKQRFPVEANKHFTYSSAESLLENLDDLSKMIQHHEQYQRKRLDELDSYYLGNNTTILKKKRRKEEHLADHRATHNFAKYVSQFIQGYMVGIPIKTQHNDETVNDTLKKINRDNDADAHNSEMILDLSIYGRAYELLYRNKEDQNCFTMLSPLETFVIYDNTVERKPIAAVRYIYDQMNSKELIVELYTEDKIYTYSVKDKQSYKLENPEEKDHYFQAVPVIEYANNRFRQGDFENVLSLIDLYDAAESDTANYMTDLNDALLVIKGRLGMMDYMEDNDTGEKIQKMKEANFLYMEPEIDEDGKEGNVSADYIYKKYDVAGVEKYKDRVQADIHKFTNTPDLNDENFSGVQSGESMKYKLFGLEQIRATKERLFKRSLRDRYRLLNNILNKASEGGFDVNDISITFTPNLPKSLKDEIDMFSSLGGELSQQTKLNILSIIENPEEEQKRIEQEMKERQKSQISNYMEN